MHPIANDLFLIRLEGDGELDGVAVEFVEVG
jgi:hypothetical protein